MDPQPFLVLIFITMALEAVTMSEPSRPITSLYREDRLVDASPEFRESANVKDPSVYARANEDLEGWWEQWASRLYWEAKWSRVLDWKPPAAAWFPGGRTNAAFNCLDIHLERRGDETALIWEGEPGDERRYSYRDLHARVCRLAGALANLGVRPGDRVALYLPAIPETLIAMLACARIGAIHTVVFAGFSAEALRDRVRHAGAKVLVTATVTYRGGETIPLKKLADLALRDCPTVEAVIVVMRRTLSDEVDETVTIVQGRDHFYHQLVGAVEEEKPPVWVDSSHPLFTLYTSGTTTHPRAIAHSTGGYLTGVLATSKWVLDLKESDTIWTMADPGWITGHSYGVYGPLLVGSTIFMYEGALDQPDRGRVFELIQKHGVSILYAAPTDIRHFMKWGRQIPEHYDLASLRLLGSVGSPLEPEVWSWYHQWIGGGRCPVVDTWWQTETGAIMIAPLPAIGPMKPGAVDRPFPGIDAIVVDEEGEEIRSGAGTLAIRKPWPSMLLGIQGDEERTRADYWAHWEGVYDTKDAATIGEDGRIRILGRVADLVEFDGRRVGTADIEAALMSHDAVSEAAVIGVSTGGSSSFVVAFLVIKDSHQSELDGDLTALENAILEQVEAKIGPEGSPGRLFFSTEIPRTRSGKIMRRLLKDIAEGRGIGDTTNVADPRGLVRLQQRYEEQGHL